ncbi:MAG: hypothetical protein FJZ09_03220 [Candidatus Omnitrophica bacterium]|nr:hypothetical protein [Candidatus Omnitrophota bacterium]
MFKDRGEKGIALFLVLGTLLVVIILTNVILVLMSSQSRLTHHQVSRIQAYYASMAGVNYAYDQLRKQLINVPPSSATTVTLHDENFPGSIVNKDVTIVIATEGYNFPDGTTCVPAGGSSHCIRSTATYTYTP